MNQFIRDIHKGEPIAVVGMALRVPGATTPEGFWKNLVAGRDCLTRPSLQKLRRSGVGRDQLANPYFVPAFPWLDDEDQFDAGFFDMGAFEAERTDPTHRLFLECAWEAMERASIVPGDNGTVTGVFGGVEAAYSQNLRTRILQNAEGRTWAEDRGTDLPIRLGNALDFVCARVSHKLNLRGPSFTVMAACATSLIAIHEAVHSLRRGECDIALAGGGSIDVPQVCGYMGSVEGMLSPTGVVRPFDADADGTVFGCGVGIMVLRPLADALAAGNPVVATIRGSATSNDGAPPEKESFIAPSTGGQRAAVQGALADAGIGGDSIGYLEAHGTATLLGDPVEVGSVAAVYQRDTSKTGYCALGSVKANVGHLRTAAGVVSTIKACLVLKHRILPPMANFKQANPALNLAAGPFYISSEAAPWSVVDQPRRAAVSSFGFGGSNAHVVLEEFRGGKETSSQVGTANLFLFSAKTPAALARRVEDTAAHLERHGEVEPDAVARTLRHGRTEMKHRACYNVAGDSADVPAFTQYAPVAHSSVGVVGSKPVVFLFPGQGAQYPGMGEELYRTLPAYRDTVDECAMKLEPHLGFDIREIIFPNQVRDLAACTKTLLQTANAQPALFVVEYALAKLFLQWGVRPQAMLGHSIGEIVAACIAGVFSLDDALKLVTYRARLMQRCEPGSMVAVLGSVTDVEQELPAEIDIAAVNAPNVTVIAGPSQAMSECVERLESRGLGTRSLHTSHAFHSAMMEPALPQFRQLLEHMMLNAPAIPVISNSSGKPLEDGEARNCHYWSDHLRQTVNFSKGITHLLQQGDAVYLEVGPGRSLSDLVRQHDPEQALLTVMHRDKATEPPATDAVTVALANLWCKGVHVDWKRYDGGSAGNMIELPPYSFDRRRYWINRGEIETAAAPGPVLYERGFSHQDLEVDLNTLDSRPWMIFMDETGLGTALAERLRLLGQSVFELWEGEQLETTGADVYRIRPGSQEDLESVFKDLADLPLGDQPRVLHLWSISGNCETHNTTAAFSQSLARGFHTMVALAKVVNTNAKLESVYVTVVADGLRCMSEETVPLFAEKGALLGPVLNIPEEVPRLNMCLADIGAFQAGQIQDWLVEEVLRQGSSNECAGVVALRASGLFKESLFSLPVPPRGNLRIVNGVTVLITGGAGALGLEYADYLFSQFNCRLAITTRWTPPPRDQWREHVAMDDKIGATLSRILELEERGAKVSLIKVDVSDLDDLANAVRQVEAELGSIGVVVHCAASNVSALTVSGEAEQAERIFKAKVHGAFNLEQVFAGRRLDAMIFLSSLSSAKNTHGQTIYSASNEVMNILAAKGLQEGIGHRCAIGFGAVEEVGMATAFLKEEDHVADLSAKSTGDVGRSFAVDHPLIRSGERLDNGAAVYRGLLRDGATWVLEHRLNGIALLPAVAILECVQAALGCLVGRDRVLGLRNVAFLRPLFVHANGCEIEIEFKPGDGGHSFEVRSRPLKSQDSWTVHATGSAFIDSGDGQQECYPPPGHLPLVSGTNTDSHVIEFGDRWDWDCLRGLQVEPGSAWARIQLPDRFLDDLEAFDLHPAMFDRGMHLPLPDNPVGELPFALSSMRICDRLPREFYVHSTYTQDSGSRSQDVRFVDEKGHLLLEVLGYIRRSVEGIKIQGEDSQGGEEYTESGLLPADHRIVVTEVGDLDAFAVEPIEPRAPGPGEVQIDVVAAGLNFRNVLETLNMVSRHASHRSRGLGTECSGIVRAVGEGSTDLRPGDCVVALGQDAFATAVTTALDWVVPLPDTISLEEGAGIPIVYLTAEYALNHLGRLRKSERILIHAAAGGVGLAAIQMAQQLGAEIFATVGSEAKREYLESLGIKHIMNSRNLDFVDEIMQITDGQGVDMVLNSLAEEFIPANFDVLRYGGRFIEIGKRDIQNNTPIGLQPFSKNLSYHAFDIGLMMEHRDPVISRMLDSVMWRFQKGELTPLPTMVIPAVEMSSGFKRMARAEHIGKNVFKLQRAADDWQESRFRFYRQYRHRSSLDVCRQTLRLALTGNRLPAFVLALNDAMDGVRSASVAEHLTKGRSRSNLETAFVAPRNELESRLAAIWENTLGVSPIGIHDDFFNLGGDSITAIQTQYMISKSFDRDLPMTLLFDCPIIADLAELLGGDTKPRKYT